MLILAEVLATHISHWFLRKWCRQIPINIVILLRSRQFCKTLKNVLDVKNVHPAESNKVLHVLKALKRKLTSHVRFQAR